MEEENNKNIDNEIEIENKDIKSEEIKEPTRNLEEDIKLLKDQLLRAVAEGENIRKRAEKQVEDAAKFAFTKIAQGLIPVVENLERATESITQEVIAENPLAKTISEGIEMTKRELFNVFERNNIVRINPIRGDKFDHNIHQAVAHIDNDQVESGSVIDVMQSGYMISDRLLKAAMVTVAK